MIFSSHYRNQNATDRVLIWRIAAAGVLMRAAALRNLLLAKAYNPDQPRIPRGYRYGGRWVGEGDDYGPPAEDDRYRSILVASLDDDDWPEIPEDRPPRARDRRDIARRIARWLGDANVTTRLAWVLARYAWLADETAHDIISYFDDPKTLDELRRAANDRPKKGYDDHHIVERTPARNDGYSDEQINNSKNVVRIPRYKHWDINGWYGTPKDDFGGLSPREYLRGKSWEERMEVGIRALIEHGVLQP